MNSDYYQGTEFDVSLSPEAGPYGNPLNEYNKERPINMYRATYHFIANIKADMPKEAKPLMWIGWGPGFLLHGSAVRDHDQAAAAAEHRQPLWQV